MAILATMDCTMNAQISNVADSKARHADTKMTIIRDTLFVLLLQLLFRATQCMRSWNY
jgi:hypothetical protein